MKTTRQWWIGAFAWALACEAAGDLDGRGPPVADDARGTCDPDGDVCDPDAHGVEPTPDGRCGNHPSASEAAAAEAVFAERLAAAPPPGPARAAIPVHVHVISDDQGVGDITDAQVELQVDVLNEAFAGTGFSFSLAAITRTRRSAWYNMAMDSAAEAEAKSALRAGDAGTLNLYVVNALNLLGWATFPWWYGLDPAGDGIVVDNTTVPGGAAAGFNGGVTAVHEVGHWLGLYHTFQSGCSFFGDFVGDTPSEKSPASGCPASRDTCPAAGADPIHNYMDYTSDGCRDEFTAGQRKRMSLYYALFR